MRQSILPRIPPTGRTEGAPPALVILGPPGGLPPVVLEGDSEVGQVPPGSAALLQPAPCCAQRRFGTSGQVSSLS